MDSKIIVDSCVDFHSSFSNMKVPFSRVPFKITINDVEIVDNGNLSMHELICRMKESKDRITTSCPSPSDFIKEIDPCKHNYIVTISSKLSGSYNSAMIAKKSVELEGSGSIDVIDSKSASAGENIVALKIYDMILNNFSRDEIVDQANKCVSRLKTRFVLNSLDNLVKNGRISNLSARFAKLLHIVPIMCDNGEGEIDLKEKVRGKSAAMIRFKNIIEQEALASGSKILAITHVNAKDVAKKIRNDLIRKNIFDDIMIFDASGLSTVYGDDGGIITAY